MHVPSLSFAGLQPFKTWPDINGQCPFWRGCILCKIIIIIYLFLFLSRHVHVIWSTEDIGLDKLLVQTTNSTGNVL